MLQRYFLGILVIFTLNTFWRGENIKDNSTSTKILIADSLGKAIRTQLDTLFVLVKGGKFRMGLNDSVDLEGSQDEKPEHLVKLKSFSIMKTEVSQQLWFEIMGNNPSAHKICSKCPVENISWYEVQKFIEKVNKLTNEHYRLPTEAEWEFAALGGTLSKGYSYSGSNEPEQVAWYEQGNIQSTHCCKEKAPNELGLFDMSGNVSEWCFDWYKEDYYQQRVLKEPTGPIEGEYKVIRGGCWLSLVDGCRVKSRGKMPPWLRDQFTGFRLVKD